MCYNHVFNVCYVYIYIVQVYIGEIEYVWVNYVSMYCVFMCTAVCAREFMCAIAYCSDVESFV